MNETIFKDIVESIKTEKLNMETIYITCKGEEYKYIFVDTYGDKLKDIRSISKTVTSLALGVAIDKGYFKNGVEENIMQYFSDVNVSNAENIKYLSEIKLKHLVTLSMGYEDMILNKSNIEQLGDMDILEYALNYPIKHNPGEYFKYTNAPVYILSCIIEKVAGMKLSEFVKQEIFSKIGISNFKWSESNQGHTIGCTGLNILPKDLQKIGKLLLSKGKSNGEQIVSEKWINEMTSLKIQTPENYDAKRALTKFGYGYNLWLSKNGIYFHDGTDGQYVIVIPAKDMLITTTGSEREIKKITECMSEILG